MGLGGYLTWTALAREIYQRTNKKIIPIENHGNMIKIIKSSVFLNNPHIVQSFDDCENSLVFPIALNNPNSNYCQIDTQDKAVHKSTKHIIETICEPYGIHKPRIKCDLFLSEEEIIAAEDVLKKFGIHDNFICIEPTSKTNYTVNRQYDFNKWQKVVNSLRKDITVVQIGAPGSRILNNVINLVGETNFRTAAAIISKSDAFLSTEGGLVHAANAVDTHAIVVLTGYQSKKMVAYDTHTYVDISSHGPCGLKIACEKCQADVANHEEQEIVKICKSIIKK